MACCGAKYKGPYRAHPTHDFFVTWSDGTESWFPSYDQAFDVQYARNDHGARMESRLRT